jgi:hypothetical protein
MSMWKWNLAFQCVVNIGVRGSENVRTRVVEADMVPVIATILDNYIQVIDKFRSKAEAVSAKRNLPTAHGNGTGNSSNGNGGNVNRNRIARRTGQTPPHAIQIPHSNLATNRTHHPNNTYREPRQNIQQLFTNQPMRDPSGLQPIANDLTVRGEFGVLQPVRDVDRLPSMLQASGGRDSGPGGGGDGGGGGDPSQPTSPVTPNPPLNPSTYNIRGLRQEGRPSIRHQRSMSDEPRVHAVNESEPIVDVQSSVDMERETMLEAVQEPIDLAGDHRGDPQDNETFNIMHRSIDGSILNAAGQATNPNNRFLPNPPTVNPSLSMSGPFPRYLPETTSAVLSTMPRDEDVLMSLQLLAYVSKYCYLRSYFQESHLVPTLSIEREIHLLDDDEPGRRATPRPQSELVEEYLQPDNFNIFPLVEKFTVRHHPADMQYWAGVVMRNLCRKDESKGGIRQCAYYECGKWEEYTRQFAKCRRCRRTKYCSKECQKSAWVYHRHWCVAAQP